MGRHNFGDTLGPFYANQIFWVSYDFVPTKIYHFFSAFYSVSIYVDECIERLREGKIKRFHDYKSWALNNFLYTKRLCQILHKSSLACPKLAIKSDNSHHCFFGSKP